MTQEGVLCTVEHLPVSLISNAFIQMPQLPTQGAKPLFFMKAKLNNMLIQSERKCYIKVQRGQGFVLLSWESVFTSRSATHQRRSQQARDINPVLD